MKWRQIPKKLESNKVEMVIQIKKWWMLSWHDCWYSCLYTYFYLKPGKKHWHRLITDLKYPPEIEHISKDNLYYKMFGIYFKI